ncbi:hypothetical protein [Dehalococcoides mccartyi]|uniref:hypothetical protein n=1 Tax=Dehalococcoides mccartyi TaxID=61435 RepID=UPI0006BD405E|nr:hypothetical protein [Dehalococcoides mccartyi]BAS31181.1 hypothetical protein IBK_0106 [Dehalococcoides mccartyi IBARAKI]
MLTEEQLKEIRKNAGRHSREKVPDDYNLRLYFGMLEILDFECIFYGDAPDGLTEQDIQAYLLEHKAEFINSRIPPPSYIGLISGRFNFLGDISFTNPTPDGGNL